MIPRADSLNLHGFIGRHTAPTTIVYTDDNRAYRRLPRPHGSVTHSRGQYVEGDASTNGIESFWAILKRAIMGTSHQFSRKHLQRYVDEFAWRHNHHAQPTLEKMEAAAASMAGKALPYAELVKEVERPAERKTPAGHPEVSKPSSKQEAPRRDRAVQLDLFSS